MTKRSRSLTHTVAASSVSTELPAVMTFVGFRDTRNVSNSAEVESVLLSVCNAAPESSTNSRSSGFILEGVG